MKPLIPRNPVYRFFAALFYYVVAFPLLLIGNWLFLGLRIHGRSQVKRLKNQGFVVVCNHVHPMDCTFLGLLTFPRKAIFTSLERLFSIPFLGALIRFMGSVPVPASAGRMKGFMEQMAQAVHGGRAACMYPEGELQLRCDHLRPFHDGAFYLAVQADVPIIPVVITHEKRGGLWRFKRRPCCTITAGPPIFPKASRSRREAAQELERKARAWMEQKLEGGTPALSYEVQEAEDYAVDLD